MLYWSQRINDAQLANQMPTIDTLSAYSDRDEATFEPMDEPKPIAVDEMKPTFLVTAGKRSIWIMPSPGTAESYQTTVIDPDTHHAVPFTVERETLRYRFFATAGSFSPPGDIQRARTRVRRQGVDPPRIGIHAARRRQDRTDADGHAAGDDLDGRARRSRRRIWQQRGS